MMRVYHSVFAAMVKSLAFLQNRLGANKKARRVPFPGRARVDRQVARALCVVLVVSLLATASPSARHTIAGLARESRVRLASWTSPNSLPTKLFRSLADSYGRYESWLSAHAAGRLRKTGNDVSAPQPAEHAAGTGSMPFVPTMIPPPPPDAPPTFTDDPLVAGATIVQALHITQLRDAVNLVRARAGLAAASWAESVAPGVQIKAAHILELRTRLDDARTALGLPAASYSLPAPSISGGIRAAHVQELRDLIKEMLGTTSSADSAVTRLDPANQTGGGGENPLSRNYNWSIPLVGLPGRSGLDLGLSLSYNSLVWTKHGSSISFNDDGGFPSPGFRLGFPVIQPLYYNSEVGKYAFMLITPDGGHTELRQVNASALYEAADSSHLLLDTATMVLRTTDGTQLSYAWKGIDYQCTQIKDRNGNFITVNYTAFGRVSTVVDTLGRVITFNYDGTNYLTSITQLWNGQGHTWASFEYYPAAEIHTDFQGLTVLGPQNGSTIKELSKVTLDDNSRFEFDYTYWGQIWKLRNYAADGHLLNYRAYNLPGNWLTPQTDCPRFTVRVDWAENWNRSGPNGTSGLPGGAEQEVQTASWIVPASASWNLPDGTPQTGTLAQVTAADGTYNKIYFAGAAGTSSGWRRGLPSLVETYGKTTPDQSSPIKQRSSVTSWTQDDENVSYPLNPRVLETNVYDYNASGQIQNRARTSVTHQTANFADGTSCRLPQDVSEYQANATTVLRRTHTDYNLAATYTDRRIIGLVSEQRLYEVDPNTQTETLMSKVGFAYDEGSIQGTDAPVQHDNTNYPASFLTGRANLSSVKRYNASDVSQFTTSTMFYNTAGAVVKIVDPANHPVLISYTDQFSADGTTLDASRPSTLAYPTMVTDPDNYTSNVRYHYDFGAVTWKQTPQPNAVANLPGPQQAFTYDSIGRLQKAANLTNGAYTRYVYPSSQSGSQNRIDTYATIIDGASEQNGNEAHSFSIADGYGRVIASASSHPDITVPTPPAPERFSGQLVLYNNVGRAIKTSNPTETYASGMPSQWAASGDDVSAGWLYTQQTYDWKGRPLVTTNTDGTTKEASYSGCGCAGGEVVTLTDETSRQQRTTTDVLGRPWRAEILNSGGSTYSTTTNTYNARDQVTLSRTYQGAETSTTYQDTITTYDGYGRPSTQKNAEQTSPTTYTYNPDDGVDVITDGRGATTTFAYNARRLVTSIAYGGGYSAPGVTLSYDGAGNRTSMTDGVGAVTYNYDQLSRLQSEARYVNDLGQSYTLTYGYDLADQVTSIAEPAQFGSTVINTYDSAGQLTDVTGSGGGASQYATGMQYRASGALKHLNYGNSLTLDLTYNNRLQAAQYDLKTAGGTRVMGVQYQYANDGRINASTDLVNSNLNRSYGYDQVGRLSLGDTASGTNNGPYKQTYGYDVWGNLTSRSWRTFAYSPYCNCTYPQTNGASSVYSNNKNTASGWIYDADGQLLSSAENGSTFNYSYDAAGRMASATQPGKTIYQSFDGDGLRGKWNENGVVTYYVRSSVLGGQVIIELDQYGGKKRGYIYDDLGETIAKQENGQVLWDLRDASGVSTRLVNAGGVVTSRIETDPLGTQVDDTQTYNYNGGGNGYAFNPNGFYGDPQQPNMGCMADGAPADCGWVARQINNGNAAQCPNNDCSARSVNGQWQSFRFTANGAGYVSNSAFFGGGASPQNAPFLRGRRRISDATRPRRVGPLGSNNEGPSVRRRSATNFAHANLPYNVAPQNTQGGQAVNPVKLNSCEEFAQSLADHLFNNTVGAFLPRGQMNVDDRTLARIGVAMQGQAVDNVDFSGRTYVKGQTPIDGFQTQLTNNTQGADVYHHILFTAGGELDTNWGAQTNGAFLLFDQQQAYRGRKESETEVRDDYAGIAVGRKMLIMGRLGRQADFAALTKQIADILCK